MNVFNSIEKHSNLNLSDQAKFRLAKTNEIKDYFNSEIKNKVNTLLLLIILTRL